MAALDNAVLARRQKDLEGFIDRYQDRLDQLTGRYIQNLGPAWKRLAAQIQDKVQKLYADAGALQDPKKLQALTHKAERLEALLSQLQADIKHLEMQQQPYYTGALKNIYEDSYYFTAFGLEQAAQVAVHVPLLTPYHVLGVLANPWLPDGANYSSRVRANTAHLAQVMRGTIATAVGQGWSWNETAHAIKNKTNESYFNAVRLARTEFTRAAGQGASQCYMNNSDVLYGKRWNAVKDSRTAPKDANNDGKIYDLDYDTPGNLGVPGQRIPNHPNCRCIWSPVLSALGVQNKERIARKDDSTDNWGQNYYTKAATYRDYAKERNLPDLGNRLANDNLRSYLRPGETVADLNKKVIYWTAKGGAIAVAKPDWDTVRKAPINTITTSPAPVQEATTTWEPAATVEEAAVYAKKFAKHVDFKRMSLDHINEVNRVLTGLFTDNVPKLSEIEVLAGNNKVFSGGAMAAYDYVYNRLFLNNAVLGNKKSLEKFITKVTESEATVKNLTAERFAKLPQKAQEFVTAYRKIGRELVDGHSIQGILTHEIGHHIDYTMLRKQVMKDVYQADYTLKGEKLSTYATTSPVEYVAEAFTAYMNGEIDRLDTDLVKLFNTVYKGEKP